VTKGDGRQLCYGTLGVAQGAVWLRGGLVPFMPAAGKDQTWEWLTESMVDVEAW